MKKAVKEWLSEEYGLDLFDDLLLSRDEHVGVLIDLEAKPVSFRVLFGTFEPLGLPLGDRFEFSDLTPFIVKNNTLSEVKGRKTFIKDFVKRILAIRHQRMLHLPIKTRKGTFWLRVLFKVLKREGDRPVLLFAQVIEIFDRVPDLVHYYKKTYQDSLTKLFTRETLKSHMETQKHTSGVFGMYIDLDNFKKINDRYGHLEGDRFLSRVGEALIEAWEYNVIYYRLGGDEFFVYLYDFDQDGALKKARAIINRIEQVGRDAGLEAISASLGMVPLSADMAYHTLLDASDRAMYASKERGSGNITLITPDAIIAYDRHEGKQILKEKSSKRELVD